MEKKTILGGAQESEGA